MYTWGTASFTLFGTEVAEIGKDLQQLFDLVDFETGTRPHLGKEGCGHFLFLLLQYPAKKAPGMFKLLPVISQALDPDRLLQMIGSQGLGFAPCL